MASHVARCREKLWNFQQTHIIIFKFEPKAGNLTLALFMLGSCCISRGWRVNGRTALRR